MPSIRLLLAALAVLPACGGDDGSAGPDAPPSQPDAASGCEPATILPSNYRPIAEVSAGLVNVTTTGGITSGTIDATAGGMSGAADNPYIYVDLRTGTKAAIDDVAALGATSWDIALKRPSLRANGGDSGPGNRGIAVVQADSLAAVTAAPATGYTTDDFADADCMLVTTQGGEPMSGFGEWYDYDVDTHVVTPKGEVYVIARNDGSHTAFRIVTYYGDTAMPMRGGYYQVEWKDL